MCIPVQQYNYTAQVGPRRVNHEMRPEQKNNRNILLCGENYKLDLMSSRATLAAEASHCTAPEAPQGQPSGRRYQTPVQLPIAVAGTAVSAGIKVMVKVQKSCQWRTQLELQCHMNLRVAPYTTFPVGSYEQKWPLGRKLPSSVVLTTLSSTAVYSSESR